MYACNCEEAKIPAGATVRRGPAELAPAPGWQRAHDCAYIKQRNRLIPEAERMADAAVALLMPNEPPSRRFAAWGTEFMKAMDELWRGRVS